MIKKPKYMKRVFSGKAVPVIGMDQGKSDLYRGDGVRNVFNLYFDASLQMREGSLSDSTYAGTINTSARFTRNRVLAEGNNIWGEAT